jgi:hypothetical protein
MMKKRLDRANKNSTSKNSTRRTNQKAQAWLSDYIIALLLFTIAALITVKIILNSFNANAAFTELKNDASKISETLLSQGYPPDWKSGNSSDIIRLGLLNTSKRLDAEKVIKAMNTSYINYTSLKPKLQTTYDFIAIFENATNATDCMINFSNFNVIGYPSFPLNDTDPACYHPLFNFPHSNMIIINRLVIYNAQIIKMVVYAWN